MSVFEPIVIPDWAWRTENARQALRERDAGAILRMAQQYGGASQHRIANAVGILQGRVSELLKGNRQVTALDVFERIADGLDMPDEARMGLGLAPRAGGAAAGEPGGLGEVVAVYPNRAAATADIRTAALSASTVDIIGVRGLGVIGLGDSVLRPSVAGAPVRKTLRALLASPGSVAARERSAQLGEPAESFASGIRHSLRRLRDLARDATVEVYLYDTPPVWRLIRLDDVYFVSSFGTPYESHELPMYKVVDPGDGVLCRGLRRSFDDLLRRADRQF